MRQLSALFWMALVGTTVGLMIVGNAAYAPTVHSYPSSPSLFLPAVSSPSASVATTPAPQDTPTGWCANKTNNNTWNQDFVVTFNPANPSIGPANRPPVTISQYDAQLGITVSLSQVAISQGLSIAQALLTVWATGWNNQTMPSTPPNAPAIWNLPITNGTQASGLLDNDKYFPDGATVYFNLTVSPTGSNPIYSPCPAGPTPVWSSKKPQPTWDYLVGGGWPSSTFLSDVQLTAYPNIFAGVYPGPFQPVVLTMTSVAGASVPIGGATLYYNVTYTDLNTGNSSVASGGESFLPTNSTSVKVSVGPYYSLGNRTSIQFYILAWTLWSGGAVNYIKGPSYTYPVTNGGTWCNTNQSFYHFLSLTTQPYPSIANGTDPAISAWVPVNVSITSNIANTSINYAYIYYNTTVNGKTGTEDYLQMHRFNATSQFTGDNFSQSIGNPTFGGFAPGTTVQFHITAADDLDCLITSKSYTFTVKPGNPAIVDGKTYFYVVAYDLGTNSYITGAKVEINNATFWDNTTTNQLGFAYPSITGSTSPLFLNMNQFYNVNVTWNGQLQYIHYDLTATSNKTLTFYFNSHHTVSPVYSESNSVFTGPEIVGIAIAAGIVVPIYFVWLEIRRKAEAEEKRVTL